MEKESTGGMARGKRDEALRERDGGARRRRGGSGCMREEVLRGGNEGGWLEAKTASSPRQEKR
jgi:hypothetical protein